MKKLITIIAMTLCLVMGFTMFTACSGEKEILVVARTSGSGTRDAFDSLVKNADGDSLAKKADGTSRDAVISTAIFLGETGLVMEKVASVKNSIGYISLGSVNNTIKAIKVDGVEATAANVLNNTYKLQRPFVIMTNKTATLTSATADFMSYLGSKQAQSVVTANKYVEQTSNYDYAAPSETLGGTIVIKGSSSVDPLMDKLIADYKTKGGSKVSEIVFEKDAPSSSVGIAAAKADTTGNVIGMSSSAMKAADATVLNHFNLALDAVAVIVNNSNTMNNITIAQLYDIYTGSVKKFTDLK